MCFCYPSHNYIIEDGTSKACKKGKAQAQARVNTKGNNNKPKATKSPRKEVYIVEDGDTWYPVDQQGHTMNTYTSPAGIIYPAPPPVEPPPAAVVSGGIHWTGATRAEVEAQNARIAADSEPPTKPAEIPYNGEARRGQVFWVRELDGTWTIRSPKDIRDKCQPGKWTYAPSGYPYFVRERPATKGT